MTPFVQDADFTLYVGDALEVLRGLPDESVHCCVTSPPYWGLRDYGTPGQLGLEATPDEYVAAIVNVFREVWRVLRSDGTLWLNLGDSYAGSWGAQSRGNTTGEAKTTLEGTSMLSARQIKAHPLGQTLTGSLKKTPGLKQKDLVGIPWRVAFALQADGWYLRSDIIWSKPNPMPESVTDRPTKAHEMIFLLTKSARYYYDAEAIRERFTVAGVVQEADRPRELGVFGDDLGFEEAAPVTQIGVRLATAILDGSHAKDDLGLLSLDPEVGKQRFDNGAGDSVARVPVIGRAASEASRFAHGDVSAKDFLREMHRLWIALPDGDQLKEAWRFAFRHVALVDSDRNGTVSIHDSGEIGQGELIHDEQYTDGPTPSRGPDGRKVTYVEARDGSAQHRSGERWPNPTGRNARSVWEIATQPYPNAHFATFPEALPERCIKAGTSERGCCPECGAPWEREFESRDVVPTVNASGPATSAYGATITAGTAAQRRSHGKQLGRPPAPTTGWRPTCASSCVNGGKFQTQNPCVVLDPFMGSGTTALVARKLGRHSIGIELSEEYARMAAQRLQQLSLLAEPA